jgi:hypothetical protein
MSRLTSEETRHWEAVGREAFARGEHRSPALNAEVGARLVGVPVGAEGADVMHAFTVGWDAAYLASHRNSNEHRQET